MKSDKSNLQIANDLKNIITNYVNMVNDVDDTKEKLEYYLKNYRHKIFYLNKLSGTVKQRLGKRRYETFKELLKEIGVEINE